MSVVCRVSTNLPSLAARFSVASHTHVSVASSRPISATTDRYTTIRSFFLKQAAHLNSSPNVTIQQSRSFHFAIRAASHRHELNPTPRLSHDFHSSLFVQTQQKPIPDLHKDQKGPHDDPPGPNPNLETYPDFIRRLAQAVPHLHRPTKDDLLNVTTSFWERARVRFKWFTIKSFRRWNADDISAFFTWFLMTQAVWIFVGTTTFFSVVFATANSLRLQEYIARAISRYLTAETGVTVAFESAIVPKWKDSRISFKNVYVSRRPPITGTADIQKDLGDGIHRAAARLDVGNHPAYHHAIDDDEAHDSLVDYLLPSDINYSMFDLDIDSIDVTLSLWKWLDGRGLVKDVTIKGVRGVLDRRSVYWDPSLDPATFRHKPVPGDFQLESLQLEDVLVTVYQPGQFRPYTASIFRGDFKRLRKQWLFYDFLSAENIVGQFDNCLFSLHKPQSMGRTTEEDLKDGQWQRMSRFRIDGVNVDHIQAMSASDGPISWITSGKLDAVVDIKFPRDPSSDVDLNAIISGIATNISNAASSQVASLADLGSERIPGQRQLAKPPLSAPADDSEYEHVPKQLSVDIDLRFRDLKAAVPIFTSELSYVNNALIRPIVAFINANRTLVPIHCRILKDLDSFHGSWTMWETGLFEDISYKTYNALAHHVTNVNLNRRLKTVSWWSFQMTAHAAVTALRKLVDSAQARELYTSL
ncbi:mitochondrial distribution and morphology protein-domain-containing protein [Hysterangium stoloniferum]|nr:mitochondrial distribution and morphology protein-domain-containing protein [Hysterangium stoloniferum]